MENFKIFGNIMLTNQKTGETIKMFNKDITNVFESVKSVSKLKECYNCDEKVNINTDKFFKNRGCYLCKECMTLFCYKCKKIRHKCFKCHIIPCTNCEDGYFYSNSWDDIDIYYCHQCRNIKVDEIYEYFEDKYNEELSLEQIIKINFRVNSRGGDLPPLKISTLKNN